MNQHKITREDIDTLLESLPLFEKPGRTFAKWGGLEKNADGSLSMPFPVYDEDVDEFFKRIGERGFIDYGYKSEDAARMLADDECIMQASLEQVKTMLTYCVRGERFCDGHREAPLAGGQVVALLKRLKAIRDSGTISPDGPAISQMRGDEPPELDEEDEEILDRVWARIAEEEERRNGKSS
jgi:Family of unknown function (DUF6508)